MGTSSKWPLVNNGNNGHERAAAALSALGRVIKDRRAELGLSQEELASRSDLHRTYISHLERSERNIAFMNLCRLAWALEFTCAELVERCENIVEA